MLQVLHLRSGTQPSSSIIAHVVHSPPPPPANSFVIGPAVINTTKDADDSQPPAPMIINSSELRGVGFNLQEVIPPEFESAEHLGRRTRRAGLRQLEGVGRKRFVLSSDDDNELRSRCE